MVCVISSLNEKDVVSLNWTKIIINQQIIERGPIKYEITVWITNEISSITDKQTNQWKEVEIIRITLEGWKFPRNNQKNSSINIKFQKRYVIRNDQGHTKIWKEVGDQQENNRN